MIGQMRTLLRVKELKEEQAFREVQRKRAELREAEAAVVAAQAAVEASARSLPDREAQAYLAVLGRVVTLSAVDDVKAEVVRLQKEHQLLVDQLDSRKAAVRRVTDELAAAMAQFRERQKHRDKYVILTDTLAGEVAAAVEHREEGEIEDLFGTRRKKLA